MVQELNQRFEPGSHLLFISGMAFPDLEYTPSFGAQCGPVTPIPFHVRSPLLRPETHIRSRGRLPVLAPVHMPEAPVYKEHGARSDKDQVGFPWKRFAVEAEAEPEAVEQLSHAQFGLRVRAANTRHVVAALFRSEYVAHATILMPRRPWPARVLYRPGRQAQ